MTRMKRYHVYGVGNALVDMEFEVMDDFLRQLDIGKGLMTLVDEKRQIELLAYLDHHKGKWACGGSAANTIIAVNHFGGKTFYSCKVATDELGDFYQRDLRDAGVDSNINGVRYDGETGRCLVMVTPDAERTMNTFLGVTETLSSEELDAESIKESQYVYIEGYLVTSPSGRAAATEARKIAEISDVKTALTFSDPAMVTYFRDGLTEMLGDGVDLLFCNEGEALAWANTDDINRALPEIKKVAKTFVVTLGSRGAIVYDGANQVSIDSVKVQAIDTNGAGDMFAGAFLYGITHGYDYTMAAKLASHAASKIVCHFGPRLHAEEHKKMLAAVFK